jgi:hypothetical protein
LSAETAWPSVGVVSEILSVPVGAAVLHRRGRIGEHGFHHAVGVLVHRLDAQHQARSRRGPGVKVAPVAIRSPAGVVTEMSSKMPEPGFSSTCQK